MRVSGEHPQVAHLPYGTGMPLRWLAALPLLLVSLGGPLVWYALVNQWVQPVLFGRLPLSSHQHITTGSVLTESQSYARVMSALIVLLLIFFVVYWRNAMMWSRILSWAGWLITFELAMQGLLGLMFLHVYNPYGGHPIATLLFLPAALVPAPLAILAARAAIWVLTRLHTRELVRSQSDIPLRSQDPTLAIWLQHNRLVTVLIHHKWYGSRYRVTVGLPWREFRYAQLGETHGGGKWWWPPATAAQLSGKILRIVGAQQQWLVPVADEHQANTYLALLIGRAEQALGDCAEGAATEQAPDVVAKRAAKARRGVAIGRSAMNAGGTPGFHGVWTLAAVAIACLPIALISFVPQVMNFVAPRGNHAVTNWPAGAIFGIIGIVALVQYVRYRRGLTYLVNHPFSAEHTHWGELDPTAMPALNTGSGQLGTAGLADWTALGPAIYPRNLPDTDVGGVRYSSVAAVRGVEGTAAR